MKKKTSAYTIQNKIYLVCSCAVVLPRPSCTQCLLRRVSTYHRRAGWPSQASRYTEKNMSAFSGLTSAGIFQALSDDKYLWFVGGRLSFQASPWKIELRVLQVSTNVLYSSSSTWMLNTSSVLHDGVVVDFCE